MRYIELSDLKNPVSRFIFGTSVNIMTKGEGADTLLDNVFDEGVNTFDTARVYGESEKNLGQWIKNRNIRDKINIITKGCHHDAQGSRVTKIDLIYDVEMSLKSLNTDYIDIYLLHRDDPKISPEAMIDALNDLVRQGKILSFGASNWTHRRIEEANNYAKENVLRGFSVSSPCFSAVKRVFDPWGGSRDVAGCSEAQAWYAENKMPVFAYSSLARGYLSGKFRSGEIASEKSVPQEYVCPENEAILKSIEEEAEEKGLTVAQTALLRILKSDMTVCPIVSPTLPRHIKEIAEVFENL